MRTQNTQKTSLLSFSKNRFIWFHKYACHKLNATELSLKCFCTCFYALLYIFWWLMWTAHCYPRSEVEFISSSSDTLHNSIIVNYICTLSQYPSCIHCAEFSGEKRLRKIIPWCKVFGFFTSPTMLHNLVHLGKISNYWWSSMSFWFSPRWVLTLPLSAADWILSTQKFVNKSSFDEGFPYDNAGLVRFSYINSHISKIFTA